MTPMSAAVIIIDVVEERAMSSVLYGYYYYSSPYERLGRPVTTEMADRAFAGV